MNDVNPPPVRPPPLPSEPFMRQVPPRPSVVSSTPPTPTETTTESKGLLDWLEELLHRMLVGAFKFPFVRLPQLIKQYVEQVFPTVVRVTKITVMFGAWVVLAVVPGACAWKWSALLSVLQTYNIPISKSVTDHAQLIRVSLYVWCGLAIAGSIWGLITVQRRRRKRLAK